MAKITYENKEFLNENSQISNINKVTDDDMNEIKNVVNENYDELSSISSVVGKFIRLGKSETQAISANADALVVWSTEKENTTNGILAKDGNNIKCVSGNHTVLVNSRLQLMSNATNRYIYIHKLSGDSDTTVSSAIFYSGTPSISTVINLSEGESVNVHVYSELAANNSNSDSFNDFTVTLLN